MPLDPFIPESAPFNAAQRLWLNGYVAGLLAGRGYVPAGSAKREPASPSVPLLILYGSQTGTAEKFARSISKEAKAQGCDARVVDAAQYNGIEWEKESNLFIVTSTYGDGEMPDNAQAFWEWLQSEEAASAVKHIRFSVLALGDTSYARFCNAGKLFDSRLERIGASRIFPRTDCDLDYEALAGTWKEGALKAVCGTAGGNGSVVVAELKTAMAEAVSSGYSAKNPFSARLLKNVPLNKPGSGKDVRHYEISLTGGDIAYEVGDALGVVPANCPELVDLMIALLRRPPDTSVSVAGVEAPLREALLYRLDISKPSKDLLAKLAELKPDAAFAGLLAADRANDLKQWLWGKDVLDLLEVAGCRLSPEALVEKLRPLAPRLYSIASSPKAHPGEVHLTVSTVRYENCSRMRKGVASTYLAERATNDSALKVYVQPTHGFKPPSSGDTRMIMVGPGTGVAPFRAFLEERQATGASGRNWLFFGDQKRGTDFLYEEQLEGWVKDGHLARLDLAFSRDQTQKVYVQDRMLENTKELWSWLADGAHFYVCGDASRMAKDVDAALHKVAETAGGLGKEGAADFVKKLKSEKRYQRDVY